MAHISASCFLLLLACVAVRAIHDPAYTGIKTKTYHRDPVIAQAFDEQQQQQQHYGDNYQTATITKTTKTTTHFDANERLSPMPTDHQRGIQYQQQQQHQPQQQHQQQYQPQHQQQPHQQQPHQQQGGYYQQQEVPVYQRNYEERQSAASTLQQPRSSNWRDAENSITEHYTGCPAGHTGQLPYAYDCRRYLNCWNGRGHIQSCAPGTVFNPETLECDHPEKVACGAQWAVGEAQGQTTHQTARYRSGHQPDVTTDNVEMLCPPGVTRLHPHPTDCTKFLNCANGNVHVQNCGPGTAYSIPQMVCDYKDKVDCSGRQGVVGRAISHNQAATRNTYAVHNQGPVTGDILCPANVSGLFPHPFDYTKFLNCKNGNTAIQNCMLDMVFSISKRYCDTKAHVTYTDHVTYIVSEVSYEYSQRLTSCPPGTDGQHLYPYSCGKYLKCVDGQMQLVDCAPGTVFSISRRSCLSEQHVAATDRVSYYRELFERTSALMTNTQTQSYHMMQCPAGLNGLFPFPFDGTKYLLCGANGKLLIETCASGSVFSLSRKYCHVRSEVGANDMIQAQMPASYGQDWDLESTYSYSNYAQNMIYLMCPPKFTGIFVHPFDCTKYFQCRNGETTIESCAPGSVYSISRKTCISRGQVEAYDRVEYLTDTQNEFSTDAATVTEQSWSGSSSSGGSNTQAVLCPPQVNGLQPHPFDCSKYLRCYNGRTAIENCPAGMVYSISRGRCDHEGQVNSNDRSSYGRGTTYGTATSTSTYASRDATNSFTPNEVSCPAGVSGMYLHPRDCTKYLNCANGVTHILSCGPGQAWEPKMQVCDLLQNVNCAGRRLSRPPQPQPHQPHQPQPQQPQPQPGEYEMFTQHVSCPGGVNGFYAHPFDYSRYIICQDGRTVVQKCLGEKVYSISRKGCLADTAVNASDHVPYTSEYWTETNVILTQNDFYLTCPVQATGTYVFPFDCTKFIKCDHGHTSVETCAPGKIFSIAKHWCVVKAEVQRGDRVGYDTETQTIYSWESKYGHSANDVVCPYGVSGLYQHPYDWTKYLNCTNGQTVIMTCPSGKVYSVSRKTCDMARRVQATDRCNKGVALREYDYQAESKTVSTGTSFAAGHSPTCAAQESGMKPHPYDCTKFLNCANGIAHIQDCGPGTAWNIQLQVCDFKHNVDCSDREGSNTREGSSTQAGTNRGSDSAQVSCPQGAPGIYPHPSDCTKFLNCANGITYIQACAPGTAWNAQLKVCDFIVNVDCSDYSGGTEWSAREDYTHRGGKSYGSFGVSQTYDQTRPSVSQSNYNQQSGGSGSTSVTDYRDRWTQMNVPRPDTKSYGQGAESRSWSEDRQQVSSTGTLNTGYGGRMPEPGWSGSGASIHRAKPSDSVLYVEGSLQPNRNYDQTSYSTPLAPLAPLAPATGSATTTTNVYYAQPVGSDEDSHETFSRTDITFSHAAPSYQINRQNQGREINYSSSANSWNSNVQPLGADTSPLPMPNPNLMPPHRDDSSAYPQQQGSIPSSVQRPYLPQPNPTLMPPYRDDAQTLPQGASMSMNSMTQSLPMPNQNLMPPPRDESSAYPPQHGQSFPLPNQNLMPPTRDAAQTLTPHTGTAAHVIKMPETHLMPPLPADRGQQPLRESEFRAAGVIVDNSPGQFAITDYQDQYPSGSHTSATHVRNQATYSQQTAYAGASNLSPSPPVADESNLFGGLQPPLPTSPEPYGTTPQGYLQPPTHPTTAMHNQITERRSGQNFQMYAPISNATVQKFSRNPHYSPSYAGVAHSRDTNWETAGRKLPQQYNGTTEAFSGDSNILTDDSNAQFSDTAPIYLNLPPPPSNREFYAGSTSTRRTEQATVDGKESPISEALRMLLRPYLNRSGAVSEDAAAQAESYIMNLAATTSTPKPASTTTTTTKKPTVKSKSNPIEAPVVDVELILAGEQHSLAATPTPSGSTPQTRTVLHRHEEGAASGQPTPHRHMHEHSKDFHNRHPQLPNPFAETERSITRPDAVYSSRVDNRHHQHTNHHHGPHQHSKEFHTKHPNLPNPYATREGDKSIAEADIYEVPNPKAESTTVPTIDLRSASAAQDCPFDCGNGKCVQSSQICDGANNCGNRKDESKCDHLGYAIRLTGGENPNMGRVEVKILDKWGYVCDDKFGLRDADVVCRELGFKLGASEVRGNSYYPSMEVNFSYLMDEVDCFGNETTLKDCNFPGWGVNNCGPDEVVGVVCKVPLLKCPNNYWLCSTSKECIPPAFVCDNTPDCQDESDESARVCNSTIEYRLEGGRNANEGRLEVKYHGEWGTVCDDDFGVKEAQVACNSFGYYGKPTIEKNIYGPGSGPIWLDQVSCFGNETAIDKCHHWTWGEHNCNHTEDVGIRCTAGPPPRRSLQKTDDRSEDDRQQLQANQFALEDIGLYAGQYERSSKYLSNQRRCGHFKSELVDEYEHPEERVLNGTVAKRGRHPWQATIRTRGRGGISSHWCGAVLISKKHLLTAAHCLAGYPKGSYFIRMGDHYANIAESSEVDSQIENWYIHEKFRDQTHMNNDIALIVLKSPVRFNDYIQPICLPEKGATLKESRLCTISGWGSIKSGVSTPSNILRAAQLPILADAICKQSFVYGSSMTDGMFCAGFMDENVDACDGDSGGPLVCSDDDGDTLYGIISWGQHCGYANKPGVYVRVEQYIDWIFEKINFSMQQTAS